MVGCPDASVLDDLVHLREGGFTMRQCASGVGVHVATVCRWQARDPDFYERMREAERVARRIHYAMFPQSEPRPKVRWRRDCPLCQARVAVRTARGKLRFWRCGRWPLCPWASWRPRASRDCDRCGSPRFWSHSRKSIACSGCGRRVTRRD